MYDVIIVGAGISGAACAYELSKYNLRIAIVEKYNDVSCGTTKANSAIIHAGYDPAPGSLMAKLNVRGAELTGDICRRLDVPYEQCGALVVAFGEEEEYTLEQLEQQAGLNGVKGCSIISGDEARKLEPYLSKDVTSALNVPGSAIICPWDYCLALNETAIRNGADLFLNSELRSIDRDSDGLWTLHCVNPNDPADSRSLTAAYVINAAGVFADRLHDMVAPHDFTIIPTLGEYYLMDKPEGKRCSRTIFQCPNESGKGVVVSPTVHGNLIVGPNIRIIEDNSTATHADSLQYIRSAGARSVPSIDFGQNIRNYAGVRARTDKHDFIIREVPEAPGFIDVAGMCSPGLASAPAVGEYVRQIIADSVAARGDSAPFEMSRRDNFICERRRIRFNQLSPEEKRRLVEEHPAYGHVICRCNTVTEGEILDSFHGPIPPRTLDGVKRRVGSSMGRCQGGFCSTQIMRIIAEQLGVSEDEIPMDQHGSWILEKEVL